MPIADYDIVKKLGEGQSAIVYQAKDKRSQKTVALKVLRDELLAHEASRAHFHREARALLGVVDEHVVSVHDYSGKDGEAPFIATELLDGADLKSLVDARGPVPSRVAAAIFTQAAAGLAAAHAQKLIHRDFSLANIFVEKSGRVVVTDFGLVASVAGARTSETFVTRGTGIVGTPLFVAPEVLKTGRYDAASDLYALGIALVYAVLGKAPAPVGEISALLAAIIDGKIQKLAGAAGVDPALAAIGDALTGPLGSRPVSAAQVALQIAASLAGANARAIVADWIDPAEATQVSRAPDNDGALQEAIAAGDVVRALGLATRDRYEVRGMLGEGGMGKVLLASDTRLKREVAVKLVLSDEGGAIDPDLRKRFHREARAMGRLRHPNIVEVLDYSGPGALLPYLVIGFVDGPTVSKVIPPGGLAENVALALVVQVCDALAAVHGEGFVHRDLKPENVFVDREGTVFLGDFGIVRASAAKSQTFVSAKTSAIGSPFFASPEQIFDPDAAGPAGDLFSLGAMLFNVLTGEMPVVAANLPECLRKLARGDLAPVPSRVAPELGALIDELRALDPEARPASAADVAARVRAMLEARGVLDARAELRRAVAAALGEHQTSVSKIAVVATGATEVRTPRPLATTTPDPLAMTAEPEERARWPYAIAAALVVSVVAIGLAWQVRARARAAPPVAPPLVSGAIADRAPELPQPPPPELAPPPVTEVPTVPAAPVAIDAKTDAKPKPRPAAREPAPEATTAVAPAPVPARPVEPEPALATPAVVRFIIKPWAKISIDGKAFGQTPRFNSVELKPGRYVVRFENPSYKTAEEIVVVKGGESREVRVTLEK